MEGSEMRGKKHTHKKAEVERGESEIGNRNKSSNRKSIMQMCVNVEVHLFRRTFITLSLLINFL